MTRLDKLIDALELLPARNDLKPNEVSAVEEAISQLRSLDKSTTYWKANCTMRARLMVRMREKLIEGARELSDEGSRVYFGDTNHADDFREFVQTLDDLAWEQIAFDAGERDYIGELRVLRERIAAAPKRVAQAVSEFDDRKSPEDQPDMMLVTSNELVAIVSNALSEE